MNGVASVMGTSLALVLAMSYGYRFVFGLAAALYALAALSATQLGRHRSETPRA
jgi:predicted MFS family arabinose efflux permease